MADRQPRTVALEIDRARTASTPQITTRGTILVPLPAMGLGADPREELEVIGRSGLLTYGDNNAVAIELKVPGTAIIARRRTHLLLTDREEAVLPWIVAQARRVENQAEVAIGIPRLRQVRSIGWNAEHRYYRGNFALVIEPQRGKQLFEPVLVHVASTCERFEPSEAHVTDFGERGAASLDTLCSTRDKERSDTQTLFVFIDGARTEIDYRLPHIEGRPTLFASTSSIPGFGLADLAVTATRLEIDGTPMPVQADTDVDLAVDGGDLEPWPAFRIPRGSHRATVVLRPRGLSDLLLRAQANGRMSNRIIVPVRVPVLLFISVILGGAAGGFLSRSKTSRSRRKMALHVVEGTLVATIVCAVLPAIPSLAVVVRFTAQSELIVFGIAALAGFSGIPLIDRVAKLAFRIATKHSEPRKAVTP